MRRNILAASFRLYWMSQNCLTARFAKINAVNKLKRIKKWTRCWLLKTQQKSSIYYNYVPLIAIDLFCVESCCLFKMHFVAKNELTRKKFSFYCFASANRRFFSTVSLLNITWYNTTRDTFREFSENPYFSTNNVYFFFCRVTLFDIKLAFNVLFLKLFYCSRVNMKRDQRAKAR